VIDVPAAKPVFTQFIVLNAWQWRVIKTMWLPTPIYERAPQFLGTYMGFDNPMTFVHFGVGFFCVAWSLCTFAMRLRHRERPYAGQTLPSLDSAEPGADPMKSARAAKSIAPLRGSIVRS
jgi:hypothetical protein